MDLPILDRAVYIPNFRGERRRFELGEIKKPLAIIISPLTVGERRELSMSMAAASKQPGIYQSALQDLNRKIFIDHVHDVENLSIGGHPITNGKELYDHPQMDSELIEEIQEAILRRSRLEEGDKKNFCPPSGS